MSTNTGRGASRSILPAVVVGASLIIVLLIVGGVRCSYKQAEPEYIPDTQVWAHYEKRNPGPVPARGGSYQLWDLHYVLRIQNNTDEPMNYHVEVFRRKAFYDRLMGMCVHSTHLPRETIGIVELRVRPGEKVEWEIMIYEQTEWQSIHRERKYYHDHFLLFVNGEKYRTSWNSAHQYDLCTGR